METPHHHPGAGSPTNVSRERGPAFELDVPPPSSLSCSVAGPMCFLWCVLHLSLSPGLLGHTVSVNALIAGSPFDMMMST